MFQVASHPVNVSFGPATMQFDQSQSSSPGAVQLPRTLTRPQFKSPSREAIAAVEPELADVPIEYIRRGLIEMGETMCATVSNIAPSLPRSVPANHKITLDLAPTSSRLPTHILALTSSRGGPGEAPLLYPTHALLIAAYCTALPTLPVTQPNSTTLPVLPLTVSSPTLFPLLQNFLLTKRHDMLLSSFFGVSPAVVSSVGSAPPPNRSSALAHILLQQTQSSMTHLMGYTSQLTAFWKLICALGVCDEEVWETLDCAWEAVLGAMNLAVAKEESTRGRRM